MINITEIAKKYNKRTESWLRTDNAKQIMTEIANKNNCSLSDLVWIVAGGIPEKQGTWVHEDVASVFVQWVSRSKKKYNYDTYLFKDSINNYIKIGKSVDYLKRYNLLITINPNIDVLFVINNDVERELHEKYKNKRIYGEWFNLTEKDIINIKKKYHGRNKKI